MNVRTDSIDINDVLQISQKDTKTKIEKLNIYNKYVKKNYR